MDHALKVQNLSVRYGKGDDAVDALRGLDFTVEYGERVAIIGRSGSGKSTLMRVMSGLQQPDEGLVRIGEHTIGPKITPARSIYAEVGLVFQNYGLVPQLSALQNVLCGTFHGRHGLAGMVGFEEDDRLRARKLLTDLGLAERMHTRASKLSGGEQQRVAIARLLHQQPRIMLLDEPVASLDVHWAAQVVDRMAAAHGGEATVIMVLHDLAMARRFADRVIFLQDGEILFDGPPDEACRIFEEMPAAPASADGSLDAPPATHKSGPQPVAALATRAATPNDLKGPGLGGLWGKTSFYVTIAILVVALYVWAALGVQFSVSRIFSNLDHAVDFGQRMFPPDFGVTGTIAQSLIETIQMALVGTTLAAFLSLPLSVMAARNISAKPIQAGARLVLNGLRTVPSIIWGLFFVAIVGLGPFPGILALTFYASGYLGKFYYEGIESIDMAPLKSLRTVGASPLQRFRWGVFPQVLPLMLGYTLYMFEYNIRAASILGIVGAGGIGFYLYTYINNFQYDRAATALLLLLVVVTIIDAASSRLRARLMG